MHTTPLLVAVAGGLLAFSASPDRLVEAFPSYQDKIPNGGNVLDGNGNASPGVGHFRPGGGGQRNQFGLDFVEAGYTWTKELCEKDSDEDGIPNGVELGDPDCVWKEGDVPQFDAFITHPGLSGDRAPRVDTCKDYTVPVNSVELDVKFNNYQIPTAQTSYVKQAFLVDFPDSQDLLVTRLAPIIDNSQVVHHMLLYGCSASNPRVTDYVEEPSSAGGMPCSDLVWAWAIGGDTFCMPNNVNIPITSDQQYLMLEIHYDNPANAAGLIDSSGLRLTYVRRDQASADMQDAGFLWNKVRSRDIAIPPGEKFVRLTAPCTLPDPDVNPIPDGVTVIASVIHAHQLGRKIYAVLDHKDSTKDSILASCEARFDFDLQEFRPVQQGFKINAGDTITTTCIYNSEDRTAVTNGGDETLDEMCLGIFIIVPRIPGYRGCTPRNPVISLVGDEEDNVCTSSRVVGAAVQYSDDNDGGATGAEVPSWIITHGLLMVLAWVVVLPISILFPLLFKHRDPNTSPGKDWFNFHRFGAISAVVMILAAFGVAYSNKSSPSHFSSTHGKLGLTAVIFAILQPIGGMLRPHKPGVGEDKSTARASWEVGHHLLGLGAVFVACAAAYTGLAEKLISFDENADTYAMVVAVAVGLWGGFYFVYDRFMSTTSKSSKSSKSLSAGMSENDVPTAVVAPEEGAF